MSRRIVVALFALLAIRSHAQNQDSAVQQAVDRDPWPRVATSMAGKITIYQPQIDAWQGTKLTFHMAVALTHPGSAAEVFGVAFATARVSVDKAEQLATFDDFQVTGAKFPSQPDSASAYLTRLRALVPTSAKTISLPRLTASLAIAQNKSLTKTSAVKNSPPVIYFSTVPAMLVRIDGTPVVKPFLGTGLQRVINTNALLAFDGTVYYLHVFDGWMQSTSLTGPFVVTWAPPAALDTMYRWAKSQPIDLLSGAPSDSTEETPSLGTSTVPVIHVTTAPAELIVSQGALDYESIAGTDLLYASNTSARVFMYIDTQQLFLLLGGRWFTAPATQGPWTYVPGKQLPADFTRIPLTSPVEPVLAAVPGTAQAAEAVIDNSIPQTTSVAIGAAMAPMQIDGTPQLAAIPGTTMQYVRNAPIPVVRLSSGTYYAVSAGVWFTAPAIGGPWKVAALVPAVIYTIPASSPIYYATFVQVYGATSTTVFVGYTPGYYGAVATPDGVVVYGTGYAYPAWVGAYYYPPPMTYGYGAAVVWTPYGGWGVSYGFGYPYGGVAIDMTYGGAMWAMHPYYGAYYGSYYGYGAAGRYGSTSYMYNAHGGYNPYTGNGYGQKYGSSYNSATGVAAAGQRTTVGNAYTGGYGSFASGSATNTRTGTTATGYTKTYGNAYTGQQVKTGQAQIANPYTGQSEHVSAVQTNQGSAVKAGNNVYGDANGDVFKDNGDGSWSKWGGGAGSSGGWGSSRGSSGMASQATSRDAGDWGERGYSGGGSGGGGGFRGGRR